MGLPQNQWEYASGPILRTSNLIGAGSTTTVAAAPASSTRKCRVIAMRVNASATGVVRMDDTNASAVLAPFTATAGFQQDWHYNPVGWADSPTGRGLVIVTDGSAIVTVDLVYCEVMP